MGAVEMIKSLFLAMIGVVFSIIIPSIIVVVGAGIHYDNSNDTTLSEFLISIPMFISLYFIYLSIEQFKNHHKVKTVFTIILIMMGILNQIILLFLAQMINHGINAG
jgi:hypothetical protein